MSLRSRFETLHLHSPEVTGWTGTAVILAPIPGHRIAIYAAILSAQNVTQFYFTNNDGTPISGTMILPSGGPLVLPIQDNQDPWFMTKPNAGLNIIVSTAGNAVFGDLYVLEVLD